MQAPSDHDRAVVETTPETTAAMAQPRRRVARTDLQVTVAGFGAAPLGNRFRALGSQSCADLVSDSWDRGTRYFDTAPMYGHGLSEARLGDALRMRPRDEFILSTKVGRVLLPAPTGDLDSGIWIDVPRFRLDYDYSYEGALRSIEYSMQRMLTDRLDMVFVHDCDRFTHGEQQPSVFLQAVNGAFRALERLRDEGTIKAIGFAVNEADVCLAAAQAADVDVLLLAGRYTLLEQDPLDDLFPLCQTRGISIISGGAFNSGILATGARPTARFNYATAPAAILERVRQIEVVCNEYGVSLRAAALQFVAANPTVASVLLSASSLSQQQATLSALGASIPNAFWDELRTRTLVREDAPTPGRDPQ